jgi:hypothetical protein
MGGVHKREKTWSMQICRFWLHRGGGGCTVLGGGGDGESERQCMQTFSFFLEIKRAEALILRDLQTPINSFHVLAIWFSRGVVKIDG